ncbi:ACT domain-containing protein ACR8 [Hordeum vulgare]|nr:ACT domain-containing protein ACR8 [Hordeum vulgare]
MATLVQVHSARKHGVLLEAVAALSEHGVCVRKGYISSDDGRWFMDVFHVTDAAGCKVDADKLLVRLESSLAAAAAAPDTLPPAKEALCLLELIGVDRPRLLSEVFAVLAALVFVRDKDPGAPIHDAAEQRGGGEAGQDSAEPRLALRDAVGWREWPAGCGGGGEVQIMSFSSLGCLIMLVKWFITRDSCSLVDF